MKPAFALLALLLLTHCSGLKSPKPGEPMRSDIDERWQAREQQQQQDSIGNEVHYQDPALQAAYEDGYAAGYLDHSRGKASDPEAHIETVEKKQRAAFVSGYAAGFAR